MIYETLEFHISQKFLTEHGNSVVEESVGMLAVFEFFFVFEFKEHV